MKWNEFEILATNLGYRVYKDFQLIVYKSGFLGFKVGAANLLELTKDDCTVVFAGQDDRLFIKKVPEKTANSVRLARDTKSNSYVMRRSAFVLETLKLEKGMSYRLVKIQEEDEVYFEIIKKED